MADAEEEQEPVVEATEEKKKAPVKAIVFTAAGAVVIGAAAAGAGYFLTPGETSCAGEAKVAIEAAPVDVAFVNIDPLVVTLGPGAQARYLKISVSLETSRSNEKKLAELTPRIRDTLNLYLRAVEERDLVEPAGMARLRAQMLRRLRLVAPGEIVRDVLITDFVLT